MDAGVTVEWRKVTCTHVDAPWPAGKCGEKMDFSAETFHCPGQTSVTLDTEEASAYLCKAGEDVIELILTAFRAYEYSG